MEKFLRKCPKCNNDICYSNIYSLTYANNKNSNCKTCSNKGANNGMYGKKGELNPFFGKKHTDETKLKMIKNRNFDAYKTDEFKNKISKLSKGKNNPMYGRSFYDIWVKKYGKDIADEKMNNFKSNLSKKLKGKNNPMYGKLSPNGSGNGWSGWYNGWFFRSIKELSYMVNVIERFNLNWVSGESKIYKIDYIDNKETNRTYRPDFIINNKYMVEIKPKNLWNSESVKIKKKFAIEFCKLHNLQYKLRDISNLSNDDLKNLYIDGKIKFIERYEKKFLTNFF